MEAGLVSILTIIFSIPLVLIVCVTVLLAIKMLRRGGPRSAATQQADEARLIQDLHRGLRKMEERVEALETILLEHERKGKDG